MAVKYLKFFFIALAIGLVLMLGYYIVRSAFRPARYMRVVEWIRNAEAHPDWEVSARDKCGDAPFIFPTDGYIGFIWDDSFRPGHRHAGLDIFGGKEVGITPIYAAYDGYLTRKADWKSSVIIRIPSDPLNPGSQIWNYYTHMADQQGNSFIAEAFPAGTKEVFVSAGTLLGYQGNYSGDKNNPTGIHLHFSIVRDDDNGSFLNELDIKNTLDPSPYFNLPLNARTNRDQIPLCGD
jgi:murein DD-endopeptidase MepM/ murein hydrolase activator NlpD